MPHVHTEPGQHDQTASAYIICDQLGPEPKLLLHMHRKLNVLLQPGGHIELHESPWQSVAHELTEETGYDITELKVMQPKMRIKPASLSHSTVHPQPFIVNTHRFADREHYHTDSAYLFLAEAAPSRPPLEGESTDLRWLTVDEILSLPEGDVLPDTREICRAALTDFYESWSPVATTDFDLSEV